MSGDARTILLVDDDNGLLELVSMRLASAGYAVTRADSGEAALACLKLSRPDAVIADLRMEGMDGMALFEAIHGEAPGLPVIILTAHGTIPEAVAATQRGVFDFLTKPVDSDILLGTVADAIRLSSAAPSAAAGQWRSGIITRSPLMEELLARAERAAASGSHACIFGPIGTGKKLLARAIHRASPRSRAPFVACDCSAFAPEQLEAELLGGAQTGDGLLLAADGGTLLLSEPGRLPLVLQAKLLRALEEGAVRPANRSDLVRTDVRIVCTSHSGLEERVAAGGFREDLYYRLGVVRLTVPSLAERREDIPLLATHFLERAGARNARSRVGWSPEAMDTLVSAAWPGNVRQLLNVVEQVAAISQSSLVPVSVVRQALDERDATLTPLDVARRAFERDYLVRILKITSGNVTKAARLAGRNRTEFYRLLDRHALEPSMFKARPSAH
jgi:two-component system response regulator GlrR